MVEVKKTDSCCGSKTLERILKVLNVKIYIDSQKCNSCGTCMEVCPFGLPQLSKETNKFEITKIEECTECAACRNNCPFDAIIMNEVKGCGCLWDTRKHIKNNSK
ncbi:MAG: 4Fe-4S dicluster domain-containing protein [Promethearchaeota archaeon]